MNGSQKNSNHAWLEKFRSFLEKILNFCLFKGVKRNYCYIYINNEKASKDLQKRFTDRMQSLILPAKAFTEKELVQILTDIAEEIPAPINYYLSVDNIDNLTNFSFQKTQNPLTDERIKRQG